MAISPKKQKKKSTLFGQGISPLYLNLGCEDKVLPGYINIDITPLPGVVVYNLNRYPLPFKDNSVDYILCEGLLEYLDDGIAFMKELHRICKPGAVIDMHVTHFSLSAIHAELSNKRPGFSYFTFGHKHWNKELYGLFKVNAMLNFTRSNQKWLNIFFNPLINISPALYERFFCYILPCSQIHFKLEVNKQAISST